MYTPAVMSKTPPKTTKAPPPPATTAPGPPETVAKTKGSENDRITIPLTDSGAPDVESMREKTKERLRRIITDPATARALGVTDAPAVAVLPREVIYAAVNAISQLETMIVARYTKAPPQIIMAIVPYTPEETQAVAGPLENVLNKYSPAVLSKYGDEIALGALLLMMTARKIEAVQAAMAGSSRPRPVVVPMPQAEPAPPADEPPPAGDQSDVLS